MNKWSVHPSTEVGKEAVKKTNAISIEMEWTGTMKNRTQTQKHTDTTAIPDANALSAVSAFIIFECLVLMVLCFDAVFALEHIVDLGQVVGAGRDEVRVAGWGVGFLEVGFLAEVAHLEESLLVYAAGWMLETEDWKCEMES